MIMLLFFYWLELKIQSDAVKKHDVHRAEID